MSQEQTNEVINNEPVVDAVQEPEIVEGVTPDTVDAPVVEEEAVDPAHAAQVEAGKAIAAQRKAARAREAELLAENELLRKQANGDIDEDDAKNMVYDPKTRRHFHKDSAVGALLWREAEAQQIEAQENESVRIKNTIDKVNAGHNKYGDKFKAAFNAFQEIGTVAMAEALKDVDEPDAVILHLGANKNKLRELANLPPYEAQQRARKEFIKIELALQGTKKMVSKAPAPVNHINDQRNTTPSYENMTYAQRAEMWKNKINPSE